MAARGSQDSVDVIVVGAGAAGATAAQRAAQSGLSVAVIEREEFPRPRACGGWLGPAGVELSRACGLEAKSCGAAEFRGLGLYASDLKKSVRVDDKDLFGWIVDRATFDQALLKKAVAAGARALSGRVPAAASLGEQASQITLNTGDSISGRILIIADGLESPTARLVKVTSAGASPGAARCAQVVFATSKTEPGVDVTVASSALAPQVTITRAGRSIRVTLVVRDSSVSAVQALAAFVRDARTAGLLPGDTPSSDAVELRVPSGLALDLDSHVGKRCLLIGDAGGFVAAFSNEGIYPSMKSGWIAAEVAAAALKAPVLQDELASFSARWRTELADYLRLPNTDLALLMPLVFSNAQMSKRVARAFLLGQKF